MDEMTLLRSVREDVAAPSTEALNRGRAALLNAAAGALAGPRRRPRRTLKRAGWAGLAVVAAGVLALTLVLTNVLGLAGWRGGADSAAADTLNSAAAAAIQNSDPVVGPGQYLNISTTSVELNVGQDVSYLTEVTDQLYIPADTNDDWVWVRPLDKPYKTFGPASAAEAAKNYSAQSQKYPNGDGTLRARAGAFYGSAAVVSPSSLKALPRNPYLLLNNIYRITLGHGTSADDEAFVYIADTLRSGLVPADLRAAFYRAAALIPGVTITANQTTLNGREGVAIGHYNGQGNADRQEIVIDPTTGLLIGEREVSLVAGDGYPAGTVTESTAVVTSVVDDAPPGGSVCGDAMVLTANGCRFHG